MFDRLPPGDTDENWLELWWAVCLAMGTAEPDSPAPRWDVVYGLAARERIATLGWLRSDALIRGLAPLQVTERWRGHALAAACEAAIQAAELGALLDQLRSDGVEAVVLKGLPLSVRLYGDASVRPCSDVDLFVSWPARATVHQSLLASGWRHVKGFAPSEGSYQQPTPAHQGNLEIHSQLLDDALLAHHCVPEPDRAFVDVEGVPVLAQRGPLELLFLAVHLAKHHLVPLLWWIDFATAWDRGGPEARAQARSLGAQLRLFRYLDWAEEGAFHLGRVASGPMNCARNELCQLRARHSAHNAVRVAALAHSSRDRVRTILGWVWPPALRGDPAATARVLASRLVAACRRLGRRRGEGPTEGVAARLEVRRPDLLALVRDVTAHGTAVWVRARGTSMFPAIPPDAEVRLVSLPDRTLRRGDVVFALLPGGQPVIHRVELVGDESVVLRGDNVERSDGIIPLADVVALADAVRSGGAMRTVRPLSNSVGGTIERLWAKLATRTSTVVNGT